MTPRILAALAAVFLGLVPVGAGAQMISGGGGVSVPFTASCATVTVSTVCWNVTETWNASGTTFAAPLQVAVTDTASASGSLLLNLLGGASGTTSEFSVRKDGAAVANSSFSIGSTGSTSLQVNTIGLGSGSILTWANGTNSFGTVDTGLSRDAAGVVDVGTGAAGSSAGSMKMTYVQLGSTTVSGLKTCNAGAEGSEIVVTDATATTFHSTVAGSGANHVKVVCLNSVWAIGG